MANEFIIKNGFISNGSGVINGVLSATTLYGNGSNLIGLNYVYSSTTINISSYQILNMGTSPIELLPQPGVNKYYDIEKIILEYTHNTTPYTYTLPIYVYIIGGDWALLPQLFITQPTSKWVKLTSWNTDTYNSGGSFSAVVRGSGLNQSVTLNTWNNTNPTLGDGTLRVIITFTIRIFGS